MSGYNDRLKPGEWEKLKAEWMHDHGLRRMEDRGVKYEDQAERKLDHDAERATGGGPPHPWPSEIAKANRQNQPGQDHGKSNGNEKANGNDTGCSM
jgi:hypothetical protein